MNEVEYKKEVNVFKFVKRKQGKWRDNLKRDWKKNLKTHQKLYQIKTIERRVKIKKILWLI
jgi:hypothetical protein